MRVEGGRLLVAGRDAEALAREHGTPLFAFDVTNVAEQARALQHALARAGLTPHVRLALKAQRAPEVLRALRALGEPGSPQAVGVDACSPGEVAQALAHGFTAAEVSFTGTNVSERDLDVIGPAGVHVNLDLLSQIDRYGRRFPGRAVGLRLNPRGGVMRGHPESLYSGSRPTKFGIYEEDLERAVALAAGHGLSVDTVHVHLANGILTDDLPAYDAALEPVARMAEKLLDLGCPLVEVNAGGGLGTPLQSGEQPLDLDAYAQILASRFGGLGVAVGAEPGEYLTNLSGVLLAEVVTVEERLGTTFVGLDVGWNVWNDYYIYERRPAVVVAGRADAPLDRAATLAGHINEGNDLFGKTSPCRGARGRDRRAAFGRRLLPGHVDRPLHASAGRSSTSRPRLRPGPRLAVEQREGEGEVRAGQRRQQQTAGAAPRDPRATANNVNPTPPQKVSNNTRFSPGRIRASSRSGRAPGRHQVSPAGRGAANGPRGQPVAAHGPRRSTHAPGCRRWWPAAHLAGMTRSSTDARLGRRARGRRGRGWTAAGRRGRGWTPCAAAWPRSSPPASCPAPPPATSQKRPASPGPTRCREPRSVVVAATPRPLTRATLTVHGEPREVAVPPHYAGYHSVPDGLASGRRRGAGALRATPPRASSRRSRPSRPAPAWPATAATTSPTCPASAATSCWRRAPRTRRRLSTRPGASRSNWRAASAAAPACAPAPAAPSAPDRFLLQTDRCLTTHNESEDPFPDWVDPAWHHTRRRLPALPAGLPGERRRRAACRGA